MDEELIESYFAALVLGDRMREAQKSYFKNRTQENLTYAKKLEKEFDETLINLSQPQYAF